MSIEICKRCSKKLLVKLYAIQCSLFFGIFFFVGNYIFCWGGNYFSALVWLSETAPLQQQEGRRRRKRGTKSTTQRWGGSSRQDKERGIMSHCLLLQRAHTCLSRKKWWKDRKYLNEQSAAAEVFPPHTRTSLFPASILLYSNVLFLVAICFKKTFFVQTVVFAGFSFRFV